MVFLSICIPTYQRAAKTDFLLQSVFDNWVDGIEVVVADNGSSDDTDVMLDKWLARMPAMVCHRWPENVGYDLNMHKVVELASGEYCWTIGSDDAVASGALAQVVETLRALKPSGMSVSYFHCDAELKPEKVNRWIETAGGRPFLIPRDQVLEKIGSYLGYISGQIFRRGHWIEALADGEWRNYVNGWTHYYMNLKMAARYAVDGWAFDPRPQIYYRSSSDADQLAHFGDVHPKLIYNLKHSSRAHEGALPMPLRAKFLRQTRRTLRGAIFDWKATHPSFRQMLEVLQVGNIYYSRYAWWWITIVPCIFFPLKLLSAVRGLVRFGLNLVRQNKSKELSVGGDS